jgi:hypothetical protein
MKEVQTQPMCPAAQESVLQLLNSPVCKVRCAHRVSASGVLVVVGGVGRVPSISQASLASGLRPRTCLKAADHSPNPAGPLHDRIFVLCLFWDKG